MPFGFIPWMRICAKLNSLQKHCFVGSCITYQNQQNLFVTSKANDPQSILIDFTKKWSGKLTIILLTVHKSHVLGPAMQILRQV